MTHALARRLALLSGLFSMTSNASVLTLPAQVYSHPAEQNPPSESDSCEHSPTVFRCVQYHHNYDGDTMTVSIPSVHPLFGQKVSVRLFGIDAPEMHSVDTCEREAARIAQRYVRGQMLKAQRIELKNVQRDKYFRILADVSLDGESLSRRMISAGLAYPYYGGTKQKVDWCAGRTLTVDQL